MRRIDKNVPTSVKLLQKQSTLRRAVTSFFIQRLYQLIPELINVMVTRVELTPDLATLRVFLHSAGNDGVEGKDYIHIIIGKLIPQVGTLRRELAQAVILRRVPDIRFCFDSVCEKSMALERLIDSVDREYKD